MLLDIDVGRTTEAVVVRLAGQLDVSGTARLRECVEPHLTPGQTVIADLSGLSFLDSAGLAVLVTMRNTARISGGRFWVEGARGEVSMILEMTGLVEILAKPGE